MTTTTKVCVYGAGAVGSHLAARLTLNAQADVSIVGRGAHLAAIQKQGIRLESGPETIEARITQAVDDAALLSRQDIVLVTLKATALPEHAQRLRDLLAPDGVAVFLNNGIPWWWNYGLPGRTQETLTLLDPDAHLWNILGPDKVIGGIIYSPNEVVAPGVVRHRGHNRFLLGEPDGSQSQRLKRVSALLDASGLPSEVPQDIRQVIWQKLLINASGNPLSALTRLDTGKRDESEQLRHLGLAIIHEIIAIAAAQGWALEVPAAQLTAVNLLSARPSMLQDVLKNRALEVDALLGQPWLFARESGIPTPVLNVVLPLLKGLDYAIRSTQQGA